MRGGYQHIGAGGKEKWAEGAEVEPLVLNETFRVEFRLEMHPSEALVEDALREVLHATTALVIAHRPSTVTLADRVALLEEGRISAVGTHSELLRTRAHYRHVISSLEDAARNAQYPEARMRAGEVNPWARP